MRRSATREIPVEIPADPSMVAVDTALAMTGQRHLVSTDEATRILRGVHAAIEDRDPPPTVERIITDALDSYAGRMMLDRDLVVNPLLDVRLALRR